MAELEPVDITSRAFKASPYAFYAGLRAGKPVCRVAVSRREEAFLVTRYADVSALLKDSRLAKDPANALTREQLSRRHQVPKLFAPLMRNMLGLDDPDHSRLKRLVQAVFTTRRVKRLEAQTQAASDELLCKLRGRATVDLIQEYALPLPVRVISDLLGVPPRDQRRFAHWSHTLIRHSTPSLSLIWALPDIMAFLRYLKRLIEMKRAAPDDDLVSDLVRAEGLGNALDGDELMAMIAILLSAGHETTTNLIANGMLALWQHPAQYARLRTQRGVIETAIEELLRFVGPVEMSTHRYARETLEIAGTVIPQGSLILGVIASANRDERQFPNPDTLDLAREPNRHLTFGEGGHYCVGAALARMEARVAITDLVERLPGLRLNVEVERLRWKPGLILRGLESLPVVVG